jgi:hypothetical protein
VFLKWTTGPLESIGQNVTLLVRFEVLTVVAMKSCVLWNITPCSPVKVNRRFGGHIASIFRVEE